MVLSFCFHAECQARYQFQTREREAIWCNYCGIRMGSAFIVFVGIYRGFAVPSCNKLRGALYFDWGSIFGAIRLKLSFIDF